MPYITVGQENSGDINLYCEDHGDGSPIVAMVFSDQAYQANWNLAVTASAAAAVACIPTWETDFRADLPKINVPILVIQGDEDRVLPYEKPAHASTLWYKVARKRWSSREARTRSRGPTLRKSIMRYSRSRHRSPRYKTFRIRMAATHAAAPATATGHLPVRPLAGL